MCPSRFKNYDTWMPIQENSIKKADILKIQGTKNKNN